jgi:succinylglutamate desuccinylase
LTYIVILFIVKVNEERRKMLTSTEKEASLSGSIHTVAIVGGTHGNELTGVYLVKKFQQYPNLIQRQSFDCITLLANPGAIAANRRYIDRDLNRCFMDEDLVNLELVSYEDKRAKELATQFKPQQQPTIDLLIDLHSTTSNMGLTLILDSDEPVIWQLAAYLSTVHPTVQIYYSADSGRQQDALRAIAKCGLSIEVGAVAQGTLRADLFMQTEALVVSILDYVEQLNQGNTPAFERQLTLYRYFEAIDYPRNQSDEINGMIHPQLQFRDYQPLHPGEPMFLRFDGTVVPYTGESIVYPVFINEAAYYEKNIALCLTQKQVVMI